jgi:hypothetical protein
VIGQARADLHELTAPVPKVVEQAAVILNVLARESEGDLLREAQEHVRFTLTVLDPQLRSFWLRVLWCLTSQGEA